MTLFCTISSPLNLVMKNMHNTAARYPSRAPPPATTRNSANGEPVNGVAPEKVPKKSMKRTIPVPSLSRDSASTRVENRLLVLSSLSRATTATGSVALISAPNIRAKVQLHPENSGTKWPMPIIIAATSPIDRITPGTARIVELTNIFLNVCRSSS